MDFNVMVAIHRIKLGIKRQYNSDCIPLEEESHKHLDWLECE